MVHAGKSDLRTIANGLLPTGLDPKTLPPEGRDEIREAIDVILKLWDYRNARLTLALEQLEKGATEIERLRMEHASLRHALIDLANDVAGNWGAFESQIRGAIGNTNYVSTSEKLRVAGIVIYGAAKAKMPEGPAGDSGQVGWMGGGAVP